VVAVPVPVSPRVKGEFASLVVNDTVAENDPEAFGANSMLKATLCPAWIETGSVGAVTE